MKQTQTMIALLMLLSIGRGASASTTAPWLEVDGQINFDLTAKDSQDYERNLRTQDAELRFQVLLKEGIKAVVKTELERALEINGNGVPSAPFDIEAFIEDAYIQIETDKISGLSRAIITAGKHKMAFGSQLSQDPMFKDNQLYDLMNEDQVIGLSVEIPSAALKIVDSIAMSIFETTAMDLNIADEWGASVKATKALSKQMQAQVSAMIKEHASKDDETRGSLGFVFNSDKGGLTVWMEGVVTHKNPKYTDSTIYGARAGASKPVGPGTVVIEYSYLENNAQELLAAYNLSVGKNMVLSPLVRYTKDETGTKDDDTTVGIRAKLQYQVQKAERNLIKN
jgi:hypothetical protein